MRISVGASNVGATAALLLLSRLHDRQLARLEADRSDGA